MIDANYLRDIRHHLHQHPDLSGEEEETASFLLNEIKKLNPTQIITEIGGHGFLVVFDSGKEGKSLLFRTELDALPIQDHANIPYQSKRKGNGHLCGHDGHMAILLGFAVYLSEDRLLKGKVSLLFQPAEETGQGAEAVIKDEKFNHLKFDEVFALHNLPGFKMHTVLIKDGAFTAAVKSIAITLSGKTSHAAEPEKGINPALAIAEIIKSIEDLNLNKPESEDFRLATLVHARIGNLAYGVSAGDAEIHYTCRCWSNNQLDILCNQVLKIVAEKASEYRLEFDYHFLESFYANQNHADSVALVENSANKLHYEVNRLSHPFKWGEDFGFFTQQFKGCLFGLGSGINQPALHHPNYDFPDELIATGVQLFAKITDESLK